jgi:hypothetical protein
VFSYISPEQRVRQDHPPRPIRTMVDTIPATRFYLDRWMRTVPQPWTAAMEATVFTGWIYDHLLPHAAALKVENPPMLRAIAVAKRKTIAST